MVIKVITSGKRKTSVARAVLTENKNSDLMVLINGRDYRNLSPFDKLKIAEPVKIAEQIIGESKLNFIVNISVIGGGEKGQIDACRLALARALVKVVGSKSNELEGLKDRHLIDNYLNNSTKCEFWAIFSGVNFLKI